MECEKCGKESKFLYNGFCSDCDNQIKKTINLNNTINKLSELTGVKIEKIISFIEFQQELSKQLGGKIKPLSDKEFDCLLMPETQLEDDESITEILNSVKDDCDMKQLLDEANEE